MALHIQKSIQSSGSVVEDIVSPAPVEAVATYALTETEALVNEYLVLHQKWEELEAERILQRMETIKTQLRIEANKGPDNEPVKFGSPLGSITFSPRPQQVNITNVGGLLEKVEEVAGVEAALSVIKVQLTSLKKILGENEIEAFSEKVPGSRSLKEVKHSG